MKHYTLENNNLQDWMLLNKQQIHIDILEAIQNANDCADFETIEVAIIQSKDHTINIDITNTEEAIDALNKCLSYFVETQQFELACIARDCLLRYKNL